MPRAFDKKPLLHNNFPDDRKATSILQLEVRSRILNIGCIITARRRHGVHTPASGACTNKGHQGERLTAALTFRFQSATWHRLVFQPSTMGITDKLNQLLSFGKGAATTAAT